MKLNKYTIEIWLTVQRLMDIYAQKDIFCKRKQLN
jgi:hypothetical protein